MDGQTIGRYEIKGKLGQGGMAMVFVAHDPRFGRDVAIKVLAGLFSIDESWRARFDREARTIAGLEHSAIVPVYDVGEEDGQPYLVMRLMSGGTLADRLRGDGLGKDDIIRVLRRVAGALDAASAAGVIHRDVKPANILFDQAGDAYLSDFGIARLAESSATLTGGSSIGTPGYMSPEQALGETVTGQSDIYSLGIVAYEMIAHRRPFASTTPGALLHAHVTEPPPPIRQFVPWLSERSELVLGQALAKQAPRFPSATDFIEQLATALDEPASTPAPPHQTFAPAAGEPLTVAVAARPQGWLSRMTGRGQRYAVTVTNNDVRAANVTLHVESDLPRTVLSAPGAVLLPPGGSRVVDVTAAPTQRRWSGAERTGELRLSATGDGNTVAHARAPVRDRPIGRAPLVAGAAFVAALALGGLAVFASGGGGDGQNVFGPGATDTSTETEETETEPPTQPEASPVDGEPTAATAEPTELPVDPTPAVARRMVLAFSAVVSPDAGCPAGGENREVFLYFPDTDELRQLTDDPCDDRQPAVSPDGAFVAFSSNRAGSDGAFDIWVQLIDGGVAERATTAQEGDFHPAWATLTSLYFHRGAVGGDIWSVNLVNFQETQITDTPGVDDREPNITADGGFLIWSAWDLGQGGECPGGGGEDFAVFQLNLTEEGAEPQQLTFGECNEINPSWSPDGQGFVYQLQRGPTGSGDSDIFVIRDLSAEGDDEGLVVDTHDNRDPAWSPDGTIIAYSREGEIWMADIETGAISRLVPQPNGMLDAQTNPNWGLVPAN